MAALADEVWLLTGNRLGEVAQQRALAGALGFAVREVPVARMAPHGREVRFDFQALRPPWPRLAISFGKTLEAARWLRRQPGASSLLVHLGLPRRLAVDALDLIVPMPADQYVKAPNVVRLRMPLNPAPPFDPDSPPARRLRAATWPRPWTALLVGGHAKRAPLRPETIGRIAHAANARARSRGGSVLATTSPRTPPDALAVLRRELQVPGELVGFTPGAGPANPLAAYLHCADELIVTGDSASMIAEAWRSGKPLLVASVAEGTIARARHGLRRLVPESWLAAGAVSGDVDVGRWIDAMAREGTIGLLGRSEPGRSYRAEEDDDLLRLVERIRSLFSAAG